MLFFDDYIVLVPPYADTKKHRHSMIHLMVSEEMMELHTDQKHSGQMILLNSFVPHRVRAAPGKTLLFLIDPGSALGENLSHKYLHMDVHCSDLPARLRPDLERALQGELANIFPDFWKHFDIVVETKVEKDQRVEVVLRGVKDGSWLFLSIPELSERVYLSESRLAHLFKEETGMNLKNYLLMKRMELAFRLVLEGQTITQAAHAAGFYDSAHLANLVRKTTGIRFSEVLK